MNDMSTSARRAREHSRGRTAQSPLEFPTKGWKDILWRVYQSTEQERLGLIAAGVTFYVILALFPALSALVSVYGLLANPNTIADQVSALYGVLPNEAIRLIRTQLDSLTQTPPGSLSLSFVVSLLVAMWSVNNAIKATFDGLNATYCEKEKRGFLHLNGLSFTFALGAVFMIVVYLIAIAVVPIVLNFVGMTDLAATLIRMLRWPILMVMSALAIALLNRYGPSRAKPKWQWVTPGSIFVMVAWVVMSSGFSLYLSNFANYDKTYGSLGAAIGVMMWVWLSTYILLVGAALNAEMEHQTARDTTTGAPEPMGERGARVADTVGKARNKS